jgi:hypothetical protein
MGLKKNFTEWRNKNKEEKKKEEERKEEERKEEAARVKAHEEAEAAALKEEDEERRARGLMEQKREIERLKEEEEEEELKEERRKKNELSNAIMDKTVGDEEFRVLYRNVEPETQLYHFPSFSVESGASDVEIKEERRRTQKIINKDEEIIEKKKNSEEEKRQKKLEELEALKKKGLVSILPVEWLSGSTFFELDQEVNRMIRKKNEDDQIERTDPELAAKRKKKKKERMEVRKARTVQEHKNLRKRVHSLLKMNEEKETHIEEFQVEYETGRIGLLWGHPPYWRGGLIVTEVISEPLTLASKQGKVKEGDYLIAIGDKNVTRMAPEDTYNYYIQTKATRPVTLKFLRIEKDACPICLKEFDSENTKIMTCNGCDHNAENPHMFHEECIKEWLDTQRKNKQKQSCPLCRKKCDADALVPKLPAKSEGGRKKKYRRRKTKKMRKKRKTKRRRKTTKRRKSRNRRTKKRRKTKRRR